MTYTIQTYQGWNIIQGGLLQYSNVIMGSFIVQEFSSIKDNTFQRGIPYYQKKIWALNPATDSALPMQNGCNCLNSIYGDPVLLHF